MASRPWLAHVTSGLWFKNPNSDNANWLLFFFCLNHWFVSHIASGWPSRVLYAVMHTLRTRETHHATDLWRAVCAQLAESKPCSAVSVLVSALRSQGEASDGVAFVPLHGVSNVDGGEVDVSLFLERTHMTRRLDYFGRFHGSSLRPCEKAVTRADSRVQQFLRHHSCCFHRSALFLDKQAGSTVSHIWQPRIESMQIWKVTERKYIRVISVILNRSS